MKEHPTISIKEAIRQLRLHGVDVNKIETSFVPERTPRIIVEFSVFGDSVSMHSKALEFQDAALGNWGLPSQT